MSFDAAAARAMTHEAQVKKTVDANIEEAKRSAAAGYRFGYYQRPYRDEQVNKEAAERLGHKGFRAGDGYIHW